MERSTRWLAMGVAVVCLASAPAALAHPGHAGHDPLSAGLLHPFLGLDHLLAAVAVGLLAVRVGRGWGIGLLPGVFVGLMIVGGVAAGIGMPLPTAEWGIAASVIVLGLLVAALPVMPAGVLAALVGLFALCHGHAHVAERAGAAMVPYLAGLAAATLVLHLAAVGLGVALVRARRADVVRVAGAAIAAGFLVVLLAEG